MSEEVSGEVIKKTQKTLGKHVKKPPLTDKLLKKPPFRFLHDVISTVVKETGFLNGLFSNEELVSDNVKDKDAKIAFLNKLIDAVKALSESTLSVKASKVVAGLEPTNTNLLLQAIGKLIDSNIDSSQYVNDLKSGNKNEKPPKKSNATKTEKSKGNLKGHKEEKGSDKGSVKSNAKKLDTPKKIKSINSIRNEEETKVKPKKISKVDDKKEHKIEKASPNNNSSKKDSNKKESSKKDKPKDESARKESNKTKESTRKETVNPESSSRRNSIKNEPIEINTTENPPNIEFNSVTDENLNNTISNNISKDVENVESEPVNKHVEESVYKNLVRPKSARPKSGDTDKMKSTQKEETVKTEENRKVIDVADLAPPKPDLAPPKPFQPTRPKSSLRPPSVRPSSARPGAPRLRPDSAFPMQEAVPMGTINVIVENVDAAAADEEETVVIETVSAEPEIAPEVSPVELDNKGHLVEQILEQIEGENAGSKKKTNIDWENNVIRNKEGATKDVNQLDVLIQNLTKTANPLGKLINFLHEDIEAMHGELQIWTNTKKQLYGEIKKQKKSNIDSNKPLLTHLDQLNQEIRKIQQEITHINCNILKNDARIKELLCK